MTIYRSKENGVIIQDAKLDDDKIKGKLIQGTCFNSEYWLFESESERLFTEEEFYNECGEYYDILMKEIKIKNDKLKEQEDKNQSILNAYNKAKTENFILLNQIEDLKDKITQPVEISRELADVIEYMKKNHLCGKLISYLKLKIILFSH